MTGEMTGAARAAALRDLEAASLIQQRTGVAVTIPARMPLAERALARETLEALSRISARSGAHRNARRALPARAAFDAVIKLQESVSASTTNADDRLMQGLRDAGDVIAALAIMEALGDSSTA
jgi:hypothetical protein